MARSSQSQSNRHLLRLQDALSTEESGTVRVRPSSAPSGAGSGHGRKRPINSALTNKSLGAQSVQVQRKEAEHRPRTAPPGQREHTRDLFRDFAEGRATSKEELRVLPAPKDDELRRGKERLRRERLQATLTPSLCSSLGVQNFVQRSGAGISGHCESAHEVRWLQDIVQNENARLDLLASHPHLLHHEEEPDSEEEQQRGIEVQKTYTVEQFLKGHFRRFDTFMESFKVLDFNAKGSVDRGYFINSAPDLFGIKHSEAKLIFRILDRNDTGTITIQDYHNLVPYVQAMSKKCEKKKHKLTAHRHPNPKDVSSSAVSSSALPAQDATPSSEVSRQPHTLRVTLFRNSDRFHKGTQLFLPRLPRDLVHLYQLCANTCGALISGGRVASLLDQSLRLVRNVSQLRDGCAYLVKGAEEPQPTTSFLAFKGSRPAVPSRPASAAPAFGKRTSLTSANWGSNSSQPPDQTCERYSSWQHFLGDGNSGKTEMRKLFIEPHKVGPPEGPAGSFIPGSNPRTIPISQLKVPRLV